jgi:hypothetical protein
MSRFSPTVESGWSHAISILLFSMCTVQHWHSFWSSWACFLFLSVTHIGNLVPNVCILAKNNVFTAMWNTLVGMLLTLSDSGGTVVLYCKCPCLLRYITLEVLAPPIKVRRRQRISTSMSSKPRHVASQTTMGGKAWSSASPPLKKQTRHNYDGPPRGFTVNSHRLPPHDAAHELLIIINRH